MMLAQQTLQLINTTLELAQEDGMRNHLGASLIGRECVREIWYIWRWAAPPKFDGRMIRLFDRGHKEEARLIEWQRRSGITVWPFEDEATEKQWRVSYLEGHFGGSLDSIAIGFPEMPYEYVADEYKTHNEKSFDKLIKLGVREAKPEHYAQTQIYMHGKQLRYTMYYGVNKNTDDLHIEVIEYNEQQFNYYYRRAQQIIATDRPPSRISNTPGWYQCKFCDQRGVCWNGHRPAQHCRTCQHSGPVAGGDGAWHCRLYGAVIPLDVQRVGCDRYQVMATL